MLTNVLGPASYGIYILALSLLRFAQYLGTFGLNQGIVKFGAIFISDNKQEMVKGLLLFSFLFSLFVSLSLAVVIFLFSDYLSIQVFNEPGLIVILKMISWALPLLIFTHLSASFCQALKRFDLQQIIINIINPLVNLLLVAVFFFIGYRLKGAVTALLLALLASSITGLFINYKLFPGLISEIKPVFKPLKVLRFSIPTMFIGISYLLLTYTDRLMLGYFGKASDVGIYSAAVSISVLMTLILGAFSLIISPIMADLYHHKRIQELSAVYQLITRWILIGTLPLFVVIILYSPHIMSLFGPSFAVGSLILVILSCGQLINVGTGPIGKLLEMTGYQDISLVLGVTLAVMNIILNYLLIPRFGGYGAAWATAVSNTTIFSGLVFFAYRLLKVKIYNLKIIVPLIAAGSGILTGLWAQNHIQLLIFKKINILPILIAWTIYGFATIIWGLSKEDKELLILIRNRIKFNQPHI